MMTTTTTPAPVQFRGWAFTFEQLEANTYSVTAYHPLHEGQADLMAADFLRLTVEADGTVDVQGGPGHRDFERLAGNEAHNTDGDLGWPLTAALCNAVSPE